MFRKQLNKSDIVHYRTRVQSDITLTSESLDSVQFISQSVSGSYWNFFKENYYNNTGSYPYVKPDTKFLGYADQNLGHYFDKYNISSSYIGISQKYFGDNIVPKSFKFTDTSISSSTGTIVNPILLDDGKGNVYSSNSYVSLDATSHASSSKNHVGNIFYDMGMVVLKETGSWSGSVSYLDLAKDNYKVDFKSTNMLYTTEYNIKIEPDEFLHTNNITSRQSISGSDKNLSQSPFYNNAVTSSIKDGWTFITTIGLYDTDYSPEPLIVARLPRAIRRNTSVPITFRLKLDSIY